MDARGRTPLHFASSAAVCRLLLEKGARADARDAEGNTPLHALLHLPGGTLRSEMGELLLAAGADAAAPNHFGVTPAQMEEARNM